MKNKIITVMLLAFMMIPLIAQGKVGAFTSFDTSPVPPTNMEEKANKILGAIQYAGFAVATGMLIYVGIKYVMSSADEKASVKQAAIYFLIGAIVVAAAPVIFGLLYDFFETAK